MLVSRDLIREPKMPRGIIFQLSLWVFKQVPTAGIRSEIIGMCKIAHFFMILCAILTISVRICQPNLK